MADRPPRRTATLWPQSGANVRGRRRPVGLAIVLVLVVPHGAAAVSPQATSRPRPVSSWGVDGAILGFSAATFLIGAATSTDIQTVPPEGLDPTGIRLGIDRDVVGHSDTDADVASNRFRDAAAIYPLALVLITAPGGERWRSGLEHAALYSEAVLLAHGVIYMAKVGVSRPRPFTYLPESERPDNSEYRVDGKRAFQSMPSGHAATAWCGMGFAVAAHLMSRPEAGWFENSAVAFTGAVLATTTSALRIEAGQHFPTDTMVGGLIAVSSGAGVPLLHRWFAGDARVPWPSGRAWLHSGLGTVLGVGVGLLLTSAFEP